MRLTALALALWPVAAPACDTALLLTIDVSNSVDPAEYRLQVDGLADALLDPEISETLVQGQSALAVMQWSGVDRQEIMIEWRQMLTPADVTAFAAEARGLIRAFVLSDTAPAEAIHFALDYMERAPDCLRRVIDVSGDGTPNSGGDTRPAIRRAERAGVQINGIAIESMGLAISTFYRRGIITRDGFVMTARMHRDYPRAIREKILKEISRVLF